jgi:uncharacterized cupredoxin-like copper-binding protein
MRSRILVWMLITSVMALGLSACGPPPPVQVDVTLSDFQITSSQTDFKAGQTYEFVISNEGAVNHEFMVMEPLAMDSMGMSMEEMDEMALLMVEEEELSPGETVTVEYTFPASASDGNLEFSCHVEGHYEQGMKLPIKVQ